MNKLLLILVLCFSFSVLADKQAIQNQTDVEKTVYTVGNYDIAETMGISGDTFLSGLNNDTIPFTVTNDNKSLNSYINGIRTEEIVIVDANTKKRIITIDNPLKKIKSIEIRTVVNGIMTKREYYGVIK